MTDNMVQDAPVTPINDQLSGQDDASMIAAYDKAMASDTPDDGVSRGEDGRFAPKDGAPAAAGKAPLEGGDGAAETGLPPQAATTAAPAHLPQAVKDAWAAMTPDAQKAYAEFTTAQDKKFSDLGRQLEGFKGINERFNQLAAQVPEFQGLSPEQMAQGPSPWVRF